MNMLSTAGTGLATAGTAAANTAVSEQVASAKTAANASTQAAQTGVNSAAVQAKNTIPAKNADSASAKKGGSAASGGAAATADTATAAELLPDRTPDPEVVVQKAERISFPVGDWFLGLNDGGIGGMPGRKADSELSMAEARARKYRQNKALGLSSSEDSAFSSLKRLVGAAPSLPDVSEERAAQERAAAYGLTMDQRKAERDLGYEYTMPNPDDGYAGELQLMEDHRSGSLVFSDLTDNGRWICRGGPTPTNTFPEYQSPPPKMKGPGLASMLKAFLGGGVAKPTPAEVPVAPGGAHPVLQFREPQQKIHVHLEDMAWGPGKKVLWDAVYDLGGQDMLKYGLPPLTGAGSQVPRFHLMCPPRFGPPHWYELTVSKVQGRGRPHMMEDFVASQTISAYRPDQEPEVMNLDDIGIAKQSCAVQ